ncbi:MAG: GerAB/ArcD/ProY family transporter [Clostridia bacterium]
MKFSVLILLLVGGSFLAKDQRKHVGRSVILAVILVGIVDILLFFLTMGSFGETGTVESLWPVMNLMQIIDIPILEIERQDALMMVFWILTEFTLINEYVFFAGIILQKIFRKRSHRKFCSRLSRSFYPFLYTAGGYGNLCLDGCGILLDRDFISASHSASPAVDQQGARPKGGWI